MARASHADDAQNGNLSRHQILNKMPVNDIFPGVTATLAREAASIKVDHRRLGSDTVRPCCPHVFQTKVVPL